MPKTQRLALLLGATGLVGSECLKALLELDYYDVIYAPTRRELNLNSEKLINQIVDFKNLDSSLEFFKVDDVYCCLGTTMAKAKTKEQFIFVDFDLIVQCAKFARDNDCQNMGIISSIGSSEKALSFYLKTKGRMENTLMELNFTSLHILRPSLLLGHRNESRLAEGLSVKVTENLGFLFKGKLSKYKPIKGSDVADFMIKSVLSGKIGNSVYESEDIPRLDS